MRALSGRADLCSINTATLGFQRPLGEVIDAVARAGFGGIAPWRREVEGQDVAGLARQIREAGLKVSGYCRSTYIPAASKAGFRDNVAANRRALDDAARLGASCFVMVVGSLPQGSKDLAGARAQVKEATAELLPHARQLGVRLALEPLHPVYAAERSCLTLLSEALDWCEEIEPAAASPALGVAIDAYHVWWDPNLARDVGRARGRIAAFHVCDWLVPTSDVLNDRGMMGDGVIDLPGLRKLVEGAGYAGLVEAEIFSAQNWWKRPIEDTLDVARQRFSTCV
ncbi:MAG: sugar phosphate isomerase/epimerase [Alphaproteobacteria bacterium]|nr:sugar phosphate isomerase/epimerase [Alphaproteobacteria bacterium]